jgi:uncharacterized protein
MKPHLLFPGLLSLGLVLTACDKAPPGTDQASASAARSEQQIASLTKRGESGETRGQSDPGVIDVRGVDGASKDPATAIERYQKAAAQGNADAQYALGLCYAAPGLWNAGVSMPDCANTVPKDDAKADEWLQKAAAQGLASAQYSLGQRYRLGEGVAKDAAKAFEWTKRAAVQGMPNAQAWLGVAYQGGDGIAADVAKAAEWYQKAAAQGYMPAQFMLGGLYESGRGVPQDTVLAYAWSNIAARPGNEGTAFAVMRRERIARRMSAAEIGEAERLSSSWTEGQSLTREGNSTARARRRAAHPEA